MQQFEEKVCKIYLQYCLLLFKNRGYYLFFDVNFLDTKLTQTENHFF